MTDAEGFVPPLKRPEFRRMLGISFTVALGFGMVIPVLPRYAESFGVALAVAGLVQLVFGLTRFSFGLVGGLVVDRFGERASTMAGLLIVSLSSYAAGLAPTFPLLVAARGFGGAGSALFIAGLMNRIIRIIEPEAMGRASGAFRASFLVGIVMGPALGGFVSAWFGLTAPFHFYATGLLLATVIAYRVMADQAVREIDPERKKPLEALRAARPLLRDYRYVIALAATFVGWWTLSGPTQFLGPIFGEQRLNLSDDMIGLAFTALAAGEILILLVAGRATDRYGRRAVIVPSLVLVAVATSLMGLSEDTQALFFVFMVLIGVGVAASGTAAGALLADAVPKGGSGTAVGVNQMAGDLGYLIAPSASGFFAERLSYGAAFAIGAIPAALIALASIRLPAGVAPRAEEEEESAVEPGTPIG